MQMQAAKILAIRIKSLPQIYTFIRSSIFGVGSYRPFNDLGNGDTLGIG